jgi:hypothetical protein
MEGPKGNPVRAAWLVFKWQNSELTGEETKEILALDPLFPWRKRPPRDEQMRSFRIRCLSPISQKSALQHESDGSEYCKKCGLKKGAWEHFPNCNRFRPLFSE